MSFDEVARSNRFGNNLSGSGMSTGSGSGAMSMRPMPRDGDNNYVRLNEKASSLITQLVSNVQSLGKLAALMNTPRDNEDLRNSIRKIQDTIKHMYREAGITIREIGGIDGGTSIDARNRKQQQQKLSTQLQSALNNFSAIEKDIARKERVEVERARSMSSAHNNNQYHSEPIGEDTRLLDERRQQITALDNEVDFNESLIEDREKGIKEIENTVIEVNEIFKDLALILSDQGDMLNSIADNVMQTHDHVESGTNELKQASTYQKSARSKMCCLLVIVLIVAGVLAAVLATQLS